MYQVLFLTSESLYYLWLARIVFSGVLNTPYNAQGLGLF